MVSDHDDKIGASLPCKLFVVSETALQPMFILFRCWRLPLAQDVSNDIDDVMSAVSDASCFELQRCYHCWIHLELQGCHRCWMHHLELHCHHCWMRQRSSFYFYSTTNSTRHTAYSIQHTANGKRQTANGKRQTANAHIQHTHVIYTIYVRNIYNIRTLWLR